MNNETAWKRALLVAAGAPFAALLIFALLALYANLAYPNDPGSGYILYFAFVLLVPMTTIAMVVFGIIGWVGYARSGRPVHQHEEQVASAPHGERSSPQYAGFWRRLAAGLVDVFAVNLVGLGFIHLLSRTAFMPDFTASGTEGRMFDIVYSVTSVVLPWLYFTFFESSGLQGTPGKRLFGVIVTDLRRQRLSWARANIRFWAKGLTLASFLVGFFIVSITHRKQAVHDLLSRTIVIRAREWANQGPYTLESQIGDKPDWGYPLKLKYGDQKGSVYDF